MFERIQAFLFGFDVFISYAKRDGTLYAANLAQELAVRGFSCSIDLFAAPGDRIPSNALWPIRHSRAMVLIATPRAAASKYVAEQIEAFRRVKQGVLFVIDVDGAAQSAVWSHLVAGPPHQHESSDSLAAGKPSRPLIEVIEEAFRSQRRHRQFSQGLTFALIAMGVTAVAFAALASIGTRATSPPAPPLPAPMAYARWSLPELLAAIWGSDWTPVLSAIALVAIGALAGIAGTVALRRGKAAEAKAVATKIERAGVAAFYRSFISYSHKDKRFAVRLQTALNDRGVDCRRDEKDIKLGDDIIQAIATLIQETDKLLLCCSEHSLTSQWVDYELAAAFEKERENNTNVVIPLDLDGYLTKWKNGYGVQMRRRLAGNYTGWEEVARFNEETERLVAALQASSSPPA